MDTKKQKDHRECCPHCIARGQECCWGHYEPLNSTVEVEKESHEGVEELIAAADAYMQETMPILDKFERASMRIWLREKLTSLNTKKHE